MLNKLAHELVEQMPKLTSQKVAEVSLANAAANQPFIKNSVMELAPNGAASGGSSAIVIAAGPSLHRNNHISAVLESGYDGTIIAADGALGHCLRGGLVPHYVVSLDSHPTRIVRWFGDPDLKPDDEDDYFRHQDLDPYVGENEIAKNQELLDLVDRFGPDIKGVICTSVSQSVTKRCLAAGMPVYWWNPIFDDTADADSLTRRVYHMNNLPCIATGGNGGSAAWVFAQAILGKTDIALIGMDFSYAPGTPLDMTQYYSQIFELFGDRSSEAFISVDNPHLGQTWFTDPPYYWYRQNLLQMTQDADCKTFNCTEGGVLFGDGVEFIPLAQFLGSHITVDSPPKEVKLG